MFYQKLFFGKFVFRIKTKILVESNKTKIRWFTPFMALGQKKPINEEDLYKPVPNEEIEYLTDKIEK